MIKRKTLNRAELTNKIYAKTHGLVTKYIIYDIILLTFNFIINEISYDRDVIIGNFGRFSKLNNPGWTCFNRKFQVYYTVRPFSRLKFYASESFSKLMVEKKDIAKNLPNKKQRSWSKKKST